MAIDEQDNENVDTQGMMLFMFNAIQALALAHPNRAVFRDVLGRAGKQQIELFESRGARTELIDAYEYYSCQQPQAPPLASLDQQAWKYWMVSCLSP